MFPQLGTTQVIGDPDSIEQYIYVASEPFTITSTAHALITSCGYYCYCTLNCFSSYLLRHYFRFSLTPIKSLPTTWLGPSA